MLNKPALKEYTLRIQPILVNGCGSGACHGGNQVVGDFHLTRLPGPMNFSPTQTRQNLAQALKFVNRPEPEKSVLLKKALEPHGGAEKPPLGSQDQPAYRALSQWVQNCAPPAKSVVAAAHTVPALPVNGGSEATGFAGARPDAATPTQPLKPVDNETETKEDLKRQLLERRVGPPHAGPPLPYTPPSIPKVALLTEDETKKRDGVLGSGAPPMIAGGEVVSKPAGAEMTREPAIPNRANDPGSPPLTPERDGQQSVPASGSPVDPARPKPVAAAPAGPDPYDPSTFNQWARQQSASQRNPERKLP